jgi:cytochrome c biogenesis protein CcmG/thiol:disulfide interchange protein DsbE
MPPLSLQLLNGGSWRLEDHRNEVIAINYWASWCAPCWEETPALMRLSRELGSHGFVVVGIAMDERNSNDVPRDVRRFVDTLHVPYAVALNPPMSQLAYGMDGLPTTLLIDREGRIAQSYVGAIHEATIRKDVEALLREPLISSR